MKKLLLDTNIILDLLGCREPFYEDTARLFSMGEYRQVNLLTSSLSIANTAYVLRKSHNTQTSRQILRKLTMIVKTLDLNGKIIELALNDNNFNDFEDAMQFFTARENHIDIIISRNQKDFKHSTIPVMNCAQFLSSLKKTHR